MNEKELRRFVGNPMAYAEQNDDGSYTPHRRELHDSMLRRHLRGERTIGTYVNVGSTARWVCFDVDTGDDAKVQADLVVAACVEMGVKEYAIGVEFSGRKGYHIWVMCGMDYREASELRRLGRGVLALADVECEVFPKQDVTRDLGNLVKLPGGIHRVSGMASEWLTDVPYPMANKTWLDSVVPNLPAAIAGRRFSTGQSERFPCLDAIQTEGAQEGSRNNQLFHLATMLRRAGVAHEYVVRIVEEVNEKGDPLDPFEVSTLLQSAEFAGPVCDQLPKDRQCGELCIRERTKGLYTRPRQLRHAQVGENVVVTLAGRDGKTVRFEHDDMNEGKGVLT